MFNISHKIIASECTRHSTPTVFSMAFIIEITPIIKKLFHFMKNEYIDDAHKQLCYVVNILKAKQALELLEKKRDDYGNTIIHLAAEGHNISSLEYLCELFPELINVRNSAPNFEVTPLASIFPNLYDPISKLQIQAALILIKRNADLNIYVDSHYTLRNFIFCKHGFDWDNELVKAVFENFNPFTSFLPDGETEFTIASFEYCRALHEVLHVDVNQINKRGLTRLDNNYGYRFADDPRVEEYLLENGASRMDPYNILYHPRDFLESETESDSESEIIPSLNKTKRWISVNPILSDLLGKVVLTGSSIRAEAEDQTLQLLPMLKDITGVDIRGLYDFLRDFRLQRNGHYNYGSVFGGYLVRLLKTSSIQFTSNPEYLEYLCQLPKDKAITELIRVTDSSNYKNTYRIVQDLIIHLLVHKHTLFENLNSDQFTQLIKNWVYSPDFIKCIKLLHHFYPELLTTYKMEEGSILDYFINKLNQIYLSSETKIKIPNNCRQLIDFILNEVDFQKMINLSKNQYMPLMLARDYYREIIPTLVQRYQDIGIDLNSDSIPLLRR